MGLIERHLFNKLLKKKPYENMILDIGCGNGQLSPFLRRYGLLIGCDINIPLLTQAKRRKSYENLICCDLHLGLPLQNKSIDLGVACEVIEDLKKTDGYKLLREMERVARHAILLSTPTHAKQTFTHRLHRSSWSAVEFKKLGFTIKGKGFKFYALTDKMPPIGLSLIHVISWFVLFFADGLWAWKSTI